MMGRPTGNQGVKQKAEDIPATICVSQGETDIEKCEVFWEEEKEGEEESAIERERVQSPVSCKVSCDHIYLWLEN